MNKRKHRLILEQISARLKPFYEVSGVQPPRTGWINAIRTGLGMSLAQLGKRAKKTAQGVRALEQREKTGAITLQSLKEIAEAIDMQLVYAIIPKGETLRQMVDRTAEKKAREIVNRTNSTMNLENQGVGQERLEMTVLEKKEELKNEIPRFLWD
jgi:predicted DNA-binding mobile mystery protein A